jgi:3-deoxy-D-manno-octulosonic-acid transferase
MSPVLRPLQVLGFRLGSASPRWPVPSSDLWVHGASIGEVAAAGSLLQALSGDGGPTVYLTSGTPEGLERAERLGLGHGRGPGPVDRLSTRTLLRKLEPRALWLVESELWPGMLAAARDEGVGVGVVGARMSERTYRRCLNPAGRTWFRLISSMVQRFATADEVTAHRLLELGVPQQRVRHCGRIKIPPSPDPGAEVVTLLARLAPGRCWIVGGCTHAGEDEALLDSGCWPLLLAPRHLDRLPAVEGAVIARGLHPVRRSEEPTRIGREDVLILDTLGELADAYQAARWTLVGGSLVGPAPHDLLEPLVAGSRLLVGPHLAHQSGEAARLAAARVLVRFEGQVPDNVPDNVYDNVPDASDQPLELAALLRELDGRQATLSWMRGGGLL